MSTTDALSRTESLASVDSGTRGMSVANASRAVMLRVAGGSRGAVNDRAALEFA